MCALVGPIETVLRSLAYITPPSPSTSPTSIEMDLVKLAVSKNWVLQSCKCDYRVGFHTPPASFKAVIRTAGPTINISGIKQQVLELNILLSMAGARANQEERLGVLDSL